MTLGSNCVYRVVNPRKMTDDEARLESAVIMLTCYEYTGLGKGAWM